MRISIVSFACFIVSMMTCALHLSAQPIHVLVWDEQQPLQTEAYENFLGNEIADRLKASNNDLELRSVNINDPHQGISDEDLDWADVLIWWGHKRQWEISPETAQRKIIKRLKAGDLNLIFLHSAHFATPFMEVMNEITKVQAHKKYPDVVNKKPIEFEYIYPNGRNVPAENSLITPAYYALKKGKYITNVRVDMPNCCFPDYRKDGNPSKLTILNSDHPISKGLPKTIEILATEMYNEPFHVPEPDEVIFEETWEAGEHFRSGMVWSLGNGKVFYFRPGHENFPVYKQPEMIQIIANACRWLSND